MASFDSQMFFYTKNLVFFIKIFFLSKFVVNLLDLLKTFDFMFFFCFIWPFMFGWLQGENVKWIHSLKGSYILLPLFYFIYLSCLALSNAEQVKNESQERKPHQRQIYRHLPHVTRKRARSFLFHLCRHSNVLYLKKNIFFKLTDKRGRFINYMSPF